jgi:hypothetical protein
MGEFWCFFQQNAEIYFVSLMLFTDEACFVRDGTNNMHNQHQ